MAVDLLILPIYISRISTAFINIAITNPIAPPITYEKAALPIQFPSSAPKGVLSCLQYIYCKDWLEVVAVSV